MTGVEGLSLLGPLQTLQSTMTALPTNLAEAAPSGGFATVLARANAAMAAVESASSGAAGTSGASATYGAFGTDGAYGSYGTGTSGAAGGDAVVADARKYLGVPYRWGGTDPSTGLDCSGFVQRVYGDLGVSLPRTSQEQSTVGTPVADLASANPGDLLFFEPGAGGPGHVGIYVGGGMMIDAPHTGSSVRVEQVWGQPCSIRRIAPSTGVNGSGPGATAAAGSGAIAGSLGVPASLVPLFESASARTGVPAALLAAVAKQESGFDPGAQSSAGAQGLMQLMPSTAAGLGVNPFDPAQAIDGAARLLAGSLQAYGGSVPLALAAYNAGGGAVARYGGIPPFPETQAYVRAITGMLAGAA
ncbi:MAG TPA: NlpC/P60 family protein [Candidatus Sulfotelmatobacter sp.]|nr:NlpC/P60 family protein [Candidatus Sulfotelmatobacter sp.]